MTAISTPEVVQVGLVGQSVGEQRQAVAPAVGLAEVVAARRLAGLRDEGVGVEPVGAHSRIPSHGDHDVGGVGVVQPSQDDEPAVPATGVEPVPVAEVLGADGDPHHAVCVGADALVGDRAVSAPRLDALVPDVLERDVPVAGVGRVDLEQQRLVVGAARRCRSCRGCRAWCRRRRGRRPAAVSSTLGWSSSSGLMVRCSVVSFMSVHAIAVNCSATSASVSGRRWLDVERLDVQASRVPRRLRRRRTRARRSTTASAGI